MQKYTSASSTNFVKIKCLHFQKEDKRPVFSRQTADSRPTVGRTFFKGDDILILQNHLQWHDARQSKLTMETRFLELSSFRTSRFLELTDFSNQFSFPLEVRKIGIPLYSLLTYLKILTNLYRYLSFPNRKGFVILVDDRSVTPCGPDVSHVFVVCC